MTGAAGERRHASLVVRPAIADDALCLSVLATQVYLDTYAIDGIRPAIARDVTATFAVEAFDQALADPRTRLLVGEVRGHHVGFAQVTLGAGHERAPAGAPSELLRLYVQEPFTGAGVGTRLLAEAERRAEADGTRVLWLTPWVHNHRALGFYRRRGYADHGSTWYGAQGESHANRVLAKALGGARSEPGAPC